MDHLIICYFCLVSVMLSCASIILMICGHLLGKGWPLGSRLWFLIVKLSLSHWYPGSSAVLDCIDSWSLHSFLLWFHYCLMLICNKECFRYIQKTLTRTVCEEGFELLASVFNFRVFGGIFPRELFLFLSQRDTFLKTIYVENSGRYTLFPRKISALRLLVLMSVKLNWASAWDFQQCGMCDLQSLRSACAYAQSDQSLC